MTGRVNWTKPAYLAPICANNKVYSYNYDYKIYSLDPATGNVITQFNPNLGVGTTPFVDGTTLYVSSATPANPTSTYFIASYNAETGAEKWRKDVGVYYDGPVVAGSKIYAINSLAASNPTLYTLKSFNVNYGDVIDSTTITGNRKGRFMIINTADKRIVTTRE
ncbi:MAG: PQQ-binding-like beta-propeller repeat protein [Chitinophagaceae bacterium]|nr:PQQ-binding-like beta-propeller repeat protein [Chitinophagaceae bacterium]